VSKNGSVFISVKGQWLRAHGYPWPPHVDPPTDAAGESGDAAATRGPPEDAPTAGGVPRDARVAEEQPPVGEKKHRRPSDAAVKAKVNALLEAAPGGISEGELLKAVKAEPNALPGARRSQVRAAIPEDKKLPTNRPPNPPAE